MKKLLNSPIALTLVSGVLFCLGRAYQAGFLSVYGLEASQFGRSSPEVLVVGFSVVLGELLSLINYLLWNWPWALAALAIVAALGYAYKRSTPFQKFFTVMIFPVRRYRWTFVVLSAVVLYVVVLGRANRSGQHNALMLLRHDHHPQPSKRKDQPPITRTTLRLKKSK